MCVFSLFTVFNTLHLNKCTGVTDASALGREYAKHSSTLNGYIDVCAFKGVYLPNRLHCSALKDVHSLRNSYNLGLNNSPIITDGYSRKSSAYIKLVKWVCIVY